MLYKPWLGYARTIFFHFSFSDNLVLELTSTSLQWNSENQYYFFSHRHRNFQSMNVLSTNLLRTVGIIHVIENTVPNFAVYLSLALLFCGLFILSLVCCWCFLFLFYFKCLYYFFSVFFFRATDDAALRKANAVVCFVLRSSHARPYIGFVFLSSPTCTCICPRNDDSQMSELYNCGLIYTVLITLLFTSH